MISFLIAVVVLILGYIFYGAFVEKVFKPDFNRKTPAVANPDGVDYVQLPTWKAFLIQLLNIAGLGPIFGAVSGAYWGPRVYLWIVFGTILGGAVHDYLCGMLSIRNDGASISEITGKYLGPVIRQIMRVFSVILLVLIGVSFMVGPAGLIALLTPSALNITFWTFIILAYYFLATFLPVDKVIGKIYPIFGLFLIFMAVAVFIMTAINSFNGTRPLMEFTFKNLDPRGFSSWPLMFITVACGAISGFHSTQTPIISRTLKNEKDGRKVFYGAMVAEGIIAMIWASAAIAFFWNKDGSGTGLQALAAIGGGNSNSIYLICTGLLGTVGGAIAMLGVIVCPITSGDTAYRSARMTLFDWFKWDEKKIRNRLVVAIPLLTIGYFISRLPYQTVWRYFSWSNQTLAMIVLWAESAYLAAQSKNRNMCWLTAIPATYMSMVTTTYFFYAPECLNFVARANGWPISAVAGFIFAAIFLGIFIVRIYSNPERARELQDRVVLERKPSFVAEVA